MMMMDEAAFNEKLDDINAVHEAGHAVVALALGATIGYVILNPPDLDSGAGGVRRSSLPLQDEMLVKFAGVGAEIIHRAGTWCTWSLLFRSSGRGDWKEAEAHLNIMAEGRSKRAVVAEAQNNVIKILTEHWPVVLDLSKELRARRLLTGEQIGRIYAESRAVRKMERDDGQKSIPAEARKSA